MARSSRCLLIIFLSFQISFCVVPKVEVEICAQRRLQGKSEEQLKNCGTKWAITNDAVVPEYWEVQEVKFFWDAKCTVQLPFFKGNTFQSSIMSIHPTHTGEMAFDDDLSTRWSANCRVLLGGCQRFQEHVGIDTVGYLPVAMDDQSPYANVRCVKTYQVLNATRYSQKIALLTWENDTDKGYHVVARYAEMHGGAWQKRPAEELGMWRIWNYAATAAPWTVAEMMFYSDSFCTKQAHGMPISSMSYWPGGINCISRKQVCDTFVAANTIDGVTIPGRPYPEPLPTMWKAMCNDWYGCGEKTSWIGLDFGQHPVVVRCIRLYQPIPHQWPLVPATFSHTLLLQSWDGYEWQDNDIFTGFTHGVYNDTRPPLKSAWRLSNNDPISDGWVIHELGFYEETDCGSSHINRISGLPINSNPELTVTEQYQECRRMEGSCAELAFDTRTATAWRSSCSTCGQHDAWIGLAFRGRKAREVRCFRLFQGTELKHLTDSVQLSYWTGTGWKRHRLEVAIAGGVWIFRPADPGTMWRLYGVSQTAQPWTVIGLNFFADDQCNIKLNGTHMSSGSELRDTVADAFDSSDETQWQATCVPPRTGDPGCAAGAAWIGMQSSTGPFEVKCLNVKQHRLRERQVSKGSVQVWDGVGFIPSSEYTMFSEMGGGAWQTFPGKLGSMWRFVVQPFEGGQGFAVTEMTLFKSVTCSGEAVQVGWPNSVPICSGYASTREVAEATGHTDHLLAMGDWGMTNPDYAFDGDLTTFWADITRYSQSWAGVDLTSQAVDVQCVKFALPTVRSLQPPMAEVQVWDGHVWITRSMITNAYRSLPFDVFQPDAVGMQRRPVLEGTMWRLQNEVTMPSWEVFEVEFYPFIDCSGKVITGGAISSIPRSTIPSVTLPEGGQLAPQLAFDKNTFTLWAAWCPKGGCPPGEAWIGLDMHEPKRVSCVRIFQTGRRDFKAERLALSVWTGYGWRIEERYQGLGGDSWNRRPAAPDSMWRVTFGEHVPELCPEHGRGSFQRSWGVSELEFFSDDDCSKRLVGPDEGAVVIASGVRMASPKYKVVKSSFSPSNAFDGNIRSYWAAQCGNDPEEDEAKCRDGAEWIGLDFSAVDDAPRDVRCLRIHQNRASSRECCDPASKIRLERWNGTDWMTMEWRHVPEDPLDPPIRIDARFENLGVCKAERGLSNRNDDLWEERRRRQSDQCILPLTTSVRLLSDPLCDKHSSCRDGGFTGQCCPSNAELGLSRCCCDFLMKGKVFEDEYTKDAVREIVGMHPILGLEYAVIRSVVVLPLIGLIVSLIVFCLANIPRPGRPERACCRFRLWSAMCQPLQSWLEAKNSIAAGFVAWFVVWQGGRRTAFLKGVAWFALSFIMGGAGFWLMISYIVAEIFIKLSIFLSLVIRAAKSPYKAGDPVDMKRMNAMSAAGLKAVSNDLSFGGIGHFCAQTAAGVVMFCTYVCRAAFDFVLMRFSLMALGLVDVTISVPEILYHFPTFEVDLKEAMDFMYTFVGLSGTGFQETFRWIFSGVPTCEGPVVLFSGMWLAGVTLLLIRWLNYDFFGIFMATKQCIKLSRPNFQKAIGLGVILSFQGGLFLFMQCIMLIFTRALKLVNPFMEANQNWTCPFDDGLISILVGRTFLVVSAIFALIVTFLCANGHFMGQDYIVREFSRYIGMDLSGLDPDGVGNEGGVIRFDTFLAMIPTTFGFWIDSWNVNGFLIKERASVYATELSLPVECAVCGELHVDYHEVMRATGMQLSLAWQLIPAGALVGKACEYLNNPPLFYCGSALKCYHKKRYMQYSLEGVPKKLHSGQFILVWSGLTLAFLKDRLMPFFVRLMGGAIYVLLVMYTVTIDRHNVAKTAKQGFTFVVLACLSKAVLEHVIPPLILIVLGIVLHAGPGHHDLELDKTTGEAPRKPPVIGQVVNGILTGGAVAVYLQHEDPWNLGTKYCTLISIAAGVFLGVWAVVMASITEACPGSRLFGVFLLTAYQVLITIAVSGLFGIRFGMAIRFVIGTCVCLLMIFMTGFAFRPAPVYHGRLAGPSAVLPLLTTSRAMCGPMGIAYGVFVFFRSYKFVISLTWLGRYWGLLACVGFAMVVGLVCGIAADKIIHTKAAQFSLPVGTLLAVIIGVLWHWAPGIAIGAFFTCLIGAFVEYYVTSSLWYNTILIEEWEAPSRPGTPALPTLVSTPQNAGELKGTGDLKALAEYPADLKETNALMVLPAGNAQDALAISQEGHSRPGTGYSQRVLSQDGSSRPGTGYSQNQEVVNQQAWVRPARSRPPKKYTMGQSMMLGDAWSKPRIPKKEETPVAVSKADHSNAFSADLLESRALNQIASPSELAAPISSADAAERLAQSRQGPGMSASPAGSQGSARSRSAPHARQGVDVDVSMQRRRPSMEGNLVRDTSDEFR